MTDLTTGVPQGTVLSPLLFSIYTSPIASIAAAHSVSQRQYADDTQLYIALSSPPYFSDIDQLETCLISLNTWFCHNGLALNPDKSEAVLFGTRQRLHSSRDVRSINIAGSTIELAKKTKILGVTLDRHLAMNAHVNEICKAGFYHIRSLRQIRRSIPIDVANAVACSLVSSRLDYANGTLYGTSQTNIDKLQRMQNAAARVVANSVAVHHMHSSDLLKQLHWLPVSCRINYKIAVLTYKAMTTSSPHYLNCLITPYIPNRSLRSSDAGLLSIPRCRLHFASRAFRVAAPTVWNALPLDVRSSASCDVFACRLKTFYFATAFS